MFFYHQSNINVAHYIMKKQQQQPGFLSIQPLKLILQFQEAASSVVGVYLLTACLGTICHLIVYDLFIVVCYVAATRAFCFYSVFRYYCVPVGIGLSLVINILHDKVSFSNESFAACGLH